MRSLSVMRRGVFATAALGLAAGGGALVLGSTTAGASSQEMTAVGSFTTYVLMHNLFPTLNNIDPSPPSPVTANQKTTATAEVCAGGLTWAQTPANTGTKLAGTTFTFVAGGTPNGSGSGKSFLAGEESPTKYTTHTEGCVDFARSSSPPKPTGTASASLDYYAYALTGVGVLVGANALVGNGTTKASPPLINLGVLRRIYGCKVTTWAAAGISTSTTTINLFWPQSGSGTRTVGSSMLGFTPETLTAAGAKSVCTTATKPLTHFKHASKATQVNEENSELGLLYSNHASTGTTHRTLKNDIYIYSAGKYLSQWNTLTNYGANKTNRYVSGGVNTVGNFVRTSTTGISGRQLVFAGYQKYTFTAPTTTAKTTPELLLTFNATFLTHPDGIFSLSPTTVNEKNEWFHLIPAGAGAATTTKSHTTVPGIRYVYNVADKALPSYNGAKNLIGFDNATNGSKSALCRGDLSSIIVSSGFQPLKVTTAPAGSNAPGATCREFPAGAFPGRASAADKWTTATFTQPTP
jgi:ABC-type phosphate transport system substrate-binding protein